MTHDDDTTRDAPDTDLPPFSVNVAQTRDITNEHLRALLDAFRRGGVEPLVFGDGNKPEAAVIPFAAFVRLMKHDHADHVRDESAFQAELSRRIADSDDARARGEDSSTLITSDEDLLAWAETVGEPFASMIEDGLRAPDEKAERDDG
ncbi:hypothetical protein [Brevibacterium oceani]|uniref:hypothetical protein n=1 Tax=Brevibacterium oceani TaxID=358099 RepID=UPI0015E6618F|nr:hypothetical protein [Brevibacterium oceani]